MSSLPPQRFSDNTTTFSAEQNTPKMTSIPKAVLYYSPVSIWSAVALLALEEKGYGDDEVDLKLVDLGKGENFDPTFLRLNPKATVPTLVVPLQKTLSEDVESRYKAITDTKTLVDFLDKSRSAMSRTHTTSSAPAPSLTPATIAATTTAKTIIDILHTEEANPVNLFFINARDESSLQSLAKEVLPTLKGKQEALQQFITEADKDTLHVSLKVKNLWKEKKNATDTLLEVLLDAGKPEGELSTEAKAKRTDFLRVANDAWGVNCKAALTALSKEIVGPFTLGDQLSVSDLHLAGWLATVVKLAGGAVTDNGNTVISKLEEYIGNGFGLPKDFESTKDGSRPPQSKLAAFWDAVRERPSWKKVYREGLF
ncbi:hypothetical protein BDQ12DRAFT_679037 [Crucibulum laeve]|uniref:GST N-terminal domain-containing protein n=1 Tax=Crucibulum laeve TaxID=68775 RepID=A0A5C3M6V4_9AGAR|nr:hypothetical protein BDQ12DRAFT_679037 [Crucibulum laeve]